MADEYSILENLKDDVREITIDLVTTFFLDPKQKSLIKSTVLSSTSLNDLNLEENRVGKISTKSTLIFFSIHELTYRSALSYTLQSLSLTLHTKRIDWKLFSQSLKYNNALRILKLKVIRPEGNEIYREYEDISHMSSVNNFSLKVNKSLEDYCLYFIQRRILRLNKFSIFTLKDPFSFSSNLTKVGYKTLLSQLEKVNIKQVNLEFLKFGRNDNDDIIDIDKFIQNLIYFDLNIKVKSL